VYYHPFMYNTGQKQRALSACQGLIDAWLDGVDRQQKVQADAIKDFCATQMDNARALSETTDMADFAARLVACAAPAPLKVVEITARFGEIAADTQRQMVECLGSHADELSPVVARSGANLGYPPSKTVQGNLGTRRKQMMG